MACCCFAPQAKKDLLVDEILERLAALRGSALLLPDDEGVGEPAAPGSVGGEGGEGGSGGDDGAAADSSERTRFEAAVKSILDGILAMRISR